MARFPLGRTAVVLAILGAVFFMLGSVGQDDGGLWADGPGWIGAVGWFGFLISALLLLLLGVVAIVRKLTAGHTKAI